MNFQVMVTILVPSPEEYKTLTHLRTPINKIRTCIFVEQKYYFCRSLIRRELIVNENPYF